MIQYKNTVYVVKYYAKNELATNPSTVNTQNRKVSIYKSHSSL